MKHEFDSLIPYIMTKEEAITKVQIVYPDARINKVRNGMCILYSPSKNINIMFAGSPFIYTEAEAWIAAAKGIDESLITKLSI